MGNRKSGLAGSERRVANKANTLEEKNSFCGKNVFAGQQMNLLISNGVCWSANEFAN